MPLAPDVLRQGGRRRRIGPRTPSIVPLVTWTHRSFPHPPRGSAEVQTLEGAILTRFGRGPLRTIQAPTFWTVGAVYDSNGDLVTASQRLGGLGGDHGVAADAERLPATSPRERLEGTWLYGGNWMGQFGHFLLETLPNLWPEPPELAGIVFHDYIWGSQVQDWQRFLIEAAGYSMPIRVVTTEPVTVDRLLLPSRPHVINGWTLPEAVIAWRRVARHITMTDRTRRRVHLSRTLVNRRLEAEGRRPRSSPLVDEAVDELLAERGFDVVYPETLPVEQQVQATVGADLVAGASGSALHLSVFSPPGARVLEFSDSRTRDVPLPSQRVLDAVCGHESALVPYTESLTDMAQSLDSLGLDRPR